MKFDGADVISYVYDHAEPERWDLTIILLLVHIPLLIATRISNHLKMVKNGLFTVYGIGVIGFLLLLFIY